MFKERCVLRGGTVSSSVVGTEEIFSTMETIFAIEKSLATANAVNLEKF